MAHGRLTVTRKRVVDPGLDPPVSKEGPEGIAARRPDHIQMIHRLGPVRLVGDRDGKAAELSGVASRQGPAPSVSGIELLEEDPPHRGLDLVEAEVIPDLEMDILLTPAVVAQPAAPGGHACIIRRQDTAASQDREENISCPTNPSTSHRSTVFFHPPPWQSYRCPLGALSCQRLCHKIYHTLERRSVPGSSPSLDSMAQRLNGEIPEELRTRP
jgi:hypothetical protein